MNYKIAMIPLLLAGIFASCNDSEELIKRNPDFVEAGYGALTLTLKYPDASQTKAVGDTLVGVAYKEEKTIKSVAFFVKTDPETVSGTLNYGSFGSYFSDEEVLAANGLQEELKEVTTGTPGEYTAKILHRSDGWGAPQVIVIANYLENGLAAKLKNITDWTTLESVVSETLSKNPQTPLLMYATKTIDAWKSNHGGVASADFEMERLVSRIDIHNNAYNKLEESKGFVLTSAQLIRPKKASYLLPNTGLVPQTVSDVPFSTSGTVEEETIGGSIVIQKLDSLYAYENDNADPATATAVQINGTYRGGKISKVIEMKKADGIGTIGDPIALARNHRYVVNINAAPDSSDITWDIVVKEWGEGDTIKVKPDYQKPDLTEALKTAIFNVGTSNVSWDETKKTIDISNSTGADATLEFKLSYTTAVVAEVVCGIDTDGSSLASTTNIVEIGTPIITYGAAKVETPIKINIPEQNADEKVPLDIYILLRNAVNLNVYDSITIKSRPNYANTSIKPVLMKDGKYWAPVNVGATSMPTTVASSGDVTSTCGQFFQWGRKQGFSAGGTNPTLANSRPTQDDLETMEENPKWANKFIPLSASNPNTQSNWLMINGENADNPAGADMGYDAWYQKLWDSNQVAGQSNKPQKTLTDPCPAGWRIPSIAEWKAMNTAAGGGRVFASSLLKIDGVGTDKLVLPAVGSRAPSNGTPPNQGSYGNYWSSSVPVSKTEASCVNFSSSQLNESSNVRAYAFSVRCIQE